MLPLDLAFLGKWANYLLYFAIGLGFGGVLELAGFGDSRKLAAQFYLRDMTVLKTMFTGILTACLLIFLSAALGWLDFSRIFVNQTYLWPGIVGGLVMGVGFVVGGYCPGTSAVSAASLKLDGLLFFSGTAVGAGLFGETASLYRDWWNSSFTERLLLSDWLGWSVGAAVMGVTVLALVFFYAAEKVESLFQPAAGSWTWRPRSGRHMAAGAGALAMAALVWGLGQPTPEEKWERLRAEYQPLLDSREVFVHPLEYVRTWHDSAVRLVTLDLRPAEAFAAFHLDAARRVDFDDLVDPELVHRLDQLPAQGVVVLVADDECVAVRAWRRLKAQGVTNLYILDQGLAGWSALFGGRQVEGRAVDLARPPAKVLEEFPPDAYPTRIKLKTSRRAVGLCS